MCKFESWKGTRNVFSRSRDRDLSSWRRDARELHRSANRRRGSVERTFPLHSPKIAAIVVTRKSRVRRAKLYFLRDRIGKKAYRLKERPMNAPPADVEKKPTRKGRKAKEVAAAAAPAAPAVKASAAKKEKKRAARAKKKEA